jgi:hypothetical protein
VTGCWPERPHFPGRETAAVCFGRETAAGAEGLEVDYLAFAGTISSIFEAVCMHSASLPC